MSYCRAFTRQPLARSISPILVFAFLLTLRIPITTPQNSEVDFTAFSGNWQGTRTLIQKGNCSIDGTDSLSNSYALTWVVDNFGSITITDTRSTVNWSGHIGQDSSVIIDKGFWVGCDALGFDHFVLTKYHGTIKDTLGYLQLSIEATEEWCPAPQSCVFLSRYFLALTKPITSVYDHASAEVPQTYSLEQNYPNPFNPTTEIRFGVPSPGLVTVRIYDIAGKEIRSLVDQVFEPGNVSVNWDGRDNEGNIASSGTYFCQMRAGNNSRVRKMLLIR